jgi:hypothetical protein
MLFQVSDRPKKHRGARRAAIGVDVFIFSLLILLRDTEGSTAHHLSELIDKVVINDEEPVDEEVK